MTRTAEKQFTCNECGTTGSLQWMGSHPCEHNQYVAESGGRCEDYPCCGHTDGDGCAALESHTSEYWARDPHLLCDHAAGVCDVWEDDEPELLEETECPHTDWSLGKEFRCDGCLGALHLFPQPEEFYLHLWGVYDT